MTDVIIVAIIVAVLGGAAFYVYKAKKSGKKCIGCPDGCSCDSKNGGTCSCCQPTSDEDKTNG
ncbi:MAG: FeoB-associated Cys-rich membrane protein [Clostridia bacterium]|nr:FeoB-associated Cys-rich membrane protein [Clostridia bacterium]